MHRRPGPSSMRGPACPAARFCLATAAIRRRALLRARPSSRGWDRPGCGARDESVFCNSTCAIFPCLHSIFIHHALSHSLPLNLSHHSFIAASTNCSATSIAFPLSPSFSLFYPSQPFPSSRLHLLVLRSPSARGETSSCTCHSSNHRPMVSQPSRLSSRPCPTPCPSST